MGEGDHMYLWANIPTVVAEVIDGEAVLINFETGSYYSLNGAGAAAWEALVGGTTIDGLVRKLESLYDSGQDEIRASIVGLTAELKEEGLIVETNAHPESDSAPDVSTPQVPFVAPSLNKFTDMQEMLLLDPIHDVGETGWPYPNADDLDPGSEAATAS
jgi:hypothetical protein